MANEIAIVNGAITLPDSGAVPQELLLKRMRPGDRRYINRLGEDIATLTAAEESVLKEERRLRRKLAESPEARKLEEIKRKKRLIAEERRDKVTKVQGVIESELEEYMPGATLGEKLLSMIDLSAPPKKLTAGKGRR